MKFELTDQQVQVIANALGNTAYAIAAPVIVELQIQINEQQTQPKATDETDV